LWVAAPGRGGEHGTGEEGDVGKAGHGLGIVIVDEPVAQRARIVRWMRE
jgi:hypothetical protein